MDQKEGRIDTEKIKIFLIYYFFYCIFAVSIGVYLAFILDTDLFIPEPQKLGKDFMFLVLEHNLRNFIMYILEYIRFSRFSNSTVDRFCRFSFSYCNRLQKPRFRRNHQQIDSTGLLEFPNMLLYQGMSQYLLFTLLFTKSIRATLSLMKKMIPLYLLSLIILVIAAVLEGYF